MGVVVFIVKELLMQMKRIGHMRKSEPDQHICTLISSHHRRVGISSFIGLKNYFYSNAEKVTATGFIVTSRQTLDFSVDLEMINNNII